MTPRVTVWFDSACPLCRTEVAWLSRLDRRGAVEFIDACAEDATWPLDLATLLARLHAREGDRILSGAAAFAAIWRAIPILRPLGLLAGWPPVTPMFEAAYRAFLRHRPRLQRLFR